MRRNKQFLLALSFIVSLFLSIVVWPTAAQAAPSPLVTYPAASPATGYEAYDLTPPVDPDTATAARIVEPQSGISRNFSGCQTRYISYEMLAAWLDVYDVGIAAYPANAAGYLGSASTQLSRTANFMGRWLSGASGPLTAAQRNVLAQYRPIDGCSIRRNATPDPATTFYDASGEIDTVRTWTVKNTPSEQFDMEYGWDPTSSLYKRTYTKCYVIGQGLQTKLAFYELMRTGVVTPAITAKLGPYDSQVVVTAQVLRQTLATSTTPYAPYDWQLFQTGVPACTS